MAKVLLLWLVTAVLLSSSCEAFKILVAFPFPSKSHGILGDGVVRHLLSAGHEVTYITPFPKKDPHPSLHQVDVSSNKKAFPNVLNIKGLMDKKVDLKDQSFIFNMMIGMAKAALEHEGVQKLMNDPKQRFDAVIAEWMFSDVYSGFAAVFDCPFIWFFPFEHFSVILSLIDEIPNPAYTPSIQSSSIPPFSFKHRMEGLFFQIMGMVIRDFKYLKIETEIYEKNFASSLAKKERPLPTFNEMRYNISLALVNSHISLGHSMRLPPNYINVGGYHIETDVKPLPDDLKKLMDGAKNGVIYFSMGSNLQSKELPDELKRDLLKMFGSLKQTVLWKFEEVLPNLPKNVHILQWAPQPSILSHRNCVLFITHGGLLSTTETVHFGVPVIGIPVFADQFLNVDKVVAKGFAKRVDLSYTMADELKVAIEDMINDPSYAETAKEISLVYHDRVVSPGTELVHWVEHVVRTRGAPHLRSPALHVPWYQKMYLDLLAVVVAIVIVLKTAIKRVCRRSKKVNIIKKKSN